MTSMFDQFEQPSFRTKNNNIAAAAEMNSMGYINVALEQDVPIFSKAKKEFTPPDKITHIAISNSYMVAALSNNTLFRMEMRSLAQSDEISLSKMASTLKLTNLFLDNSSNHLLISFSPKTNDVGPELFYLSKKSNKFKSATKFKGHEITSVAWDTLNESDSNTGPILLGTSKGLIFETEIENEGDKFFTSGFSSIEQYWRQIFDIGKGTNTPIVALQYFNTPGSKKCAIFTATSQRLYYFHGQVLTDEKPVLLQVFNKYLNVPEISTYIEVESKLRYSRFKFYSENLITPDSFAWMTEKGIHYCELSNDLETTLGDIKTNLQTIPFPKPLYEDYSVSQKFPISFVLTKFHMLLAYSDTIKGLCFMNQDVIYEDNHNEAFGRLINVVKDLATGDIWAVSENAVFRFRIFKEERNVWQIFADKQQFDLAKKYSQGNEVCYNQVLLKEAAMLFDKKKFELSAEAYAEAQSSFEEICLKFIQEDQQDALKLFLRRKLDKLKKNDKTQISMIVIWLIELYLGKLEEKRLNGLEQSTAYREIQKEFEDFLALDAVNDCIKKNKSTIYDLMSSHGDKTNMIRLTILNKDFEQLIRQHIYKNSYHDALDVLKSQNNYELYYQYAPLLMQEVPKHMVEALMKNGRKLSPVKLLPALVSCTGEHQCLEVIKYLEFCIDKLKNSDKSLHNFLLSLYATYSPSKLMSYLEGQGMELTLINFDVHFVLRLCQEKKLTAACVHLCSLLGLWESAMDLALQINLELAKEIARKPPEEDVELRKKLWLKIAQHVVSGKDDIETAMEFLQQTDLIRIEDVLPFFSDFITIDHFKAAICNSLKEYNQRIQDLKDEMDEATKSADQVREQISQVRNRMTVVSNKDVCEICDIILLSKPFYLFPCLHKFHVDCLKEELEPLLSTGKRHKLSDLETSLRQLQASKIDNISTNSTGMTKIDNCKAEIDNILGSECLYCGEIMIRNIDKPFIADSEYEKIKKDWE